MKTPNAHQTSQLNPPLRIFSAASLTEAPRNSSRFQRPKIKSLVNHDRVARYFTRRGFSFGSSLD